MRIHALILCMLICVASAFAKDVITKTDGTKLDAKVEEITETVIKYRKATNPTGPVYTIPISSVATVLYENGDIDTFNSSVSTPVVPDNQTVTPSDDELMQLAESQTYSNQSRYVSDADLLKMHDGGFTTAEVKHKVNKYKRIGTIGGVSFVAAGLLGGMILWGIWSWDASDFGGCGAIMGIGVLAGAGWYIGYQIKANSLMKQARQMQSYSATVIESEMMQFGNNKLTAGINVMGNQMVNSHSLGLSVGLNF